jgi:hypothetical protein
MDRMKAITMCVNRFDEETKTAMVDLYTKVDGDVNPGATDDEAGPVNEVSTDTDSNDVPF